MLPAHVGRFKHSAALAKSVCTEVDIDNVYFDTHDRLLQRHRMALRVRQIGRRWVQTLKTERKNSGAVSRRGEWETPARVVRGHGSTRPCATGGIAVAGIAGETEGCEPTLQPVFRTRVRRAQWTVERGDAVIEVALDVGEISVEGSTINRCANRYAKSSWS